MKNILQHFNKIKDNRSNQGKRYRLNSILALVSIGYMAGCDSLLKTHIFGQRMTKTNRQKLGFTSSMPSHPTITQTLKIIDPEEFEVVLSQLLACQLNQNFIQIAIDGKSIRSTSDSTKGLLHLVSAFAPEVGAMLIQSKSGLGGGEIATTKKLITNLDIKNKVITGDALYAQEVLSNKIVSRSGDYVFKVKRNKKKIIDDIKQGFEHYSQNNLEIDSYEYTVKGYGRIDSRKIEAIESHRKYFAGWAMNTIKQAAIITSKTFNIRKQTERIETHFIISSLERSKASAKDLLDFSVSHWGIENNLHRVRDTIFKEDVCNIICQKLQQINASMRNFAIFLLNKIHNSITAAIDKINQQISLAINIIKARI